MLRGFSKEFLKLFSKTLRLLVYFVFREITNVGKHLRAELKFKYLSSYSYFHLVLQFIF